MAIVKLHNKKEPLAPAMFQPIGTVKVRRQKDGTFLKFKVIDLIVEYPPSAIYSKAWETHEKRWIPANATDESEIVLNKDTIQHFKNNMYSL